MVNFNQVPSKNQRFLFAWLGNQLRFRFKRDDLDHAQWLQQDFNISNTEFEKVVVGYVLPGQIQIYQGSTHSKVDIEQLDIDDIKLLAVFGYLAFGTENNMLCNGDYCPPEEQQLIVIPDVESEEWDPLDKKLESIL